MAHTHDHDHSHSHAHHDHGFKFIDMVTAKPAETDKALTQYDITVSLSSQKEAYTAIYNQMAATVEVPGFRKGLAPREAVEPKIYGDLIKNLQNLLLNNTLVELPEYVLDKQNKYLVDLIKVEKVGLTLVESPMTVTVTGLTLQPKLAEAKKIKLELSKLEKIAVDEKEIDQALNDVYQGWKNQAKDEKILKKHPEPSDQWVKEVLAVKTIQTMTELREQLKKQLVTQKKKIIKEELLKVLLSQMAKLSKIELPDSYLELKVKADIDEAEERFRSMGTTLEKYLQLQQNKSLDDFKKDLKEQIRDQVSTDVLFRMYRRQHELTIDKDNQEDKDFVTAAQQYVQPLRGSKDKQPSQDELLDYAQRVIGVALNIKTQVKMAKEAGLDLLDT